MKIRPTELGTGHDAVHGQPEQATRPQVDGKGGASGPGSVQLNLDSSIADQLDPAQIIAARQARVEELKALVNSKQYSRSSDLIARSLAEEITIEILSSRGIAEVEEA